MVCGKTDEQKEMEYNIWGVKNLDQKEKRLESKAFLPRRPQEIPEYAIIAKVYLCRECGQMIREYPAPDKITQLYCPSCGLSNKLTKSGGNPI